MKQNKIQNIIETVTLIDEMSDAELDAFTVRSSVLYMSHIIFDSIRGLPSTDDTVDLLHLLARTIKAHIDDVNSKCDESADVDA